MRSSLYIGATGMKSLSEGMHVTTNNLANCSTIGFKSQMALYNDLIYEEQANPGEWNFAQANSHVAVGQHGMGVHIEEIATNFTQGTLESTNSLTDLAINGKGYFMVQDAQGNTFYTRAGNFIVDNEGTIRNPNGLALLGEFNPPAERESETTEAANAAAADNTETAETDTDTDNTSQHNNIKLKRMDNAQLEPISIDKFEPKLIRATANITVQDTNLIPASNVLDDSSNPYFSMLSNYDATQSQPLNSDQYSNSQSTTIYDSEGNGHKVTIYYDGAPSSTSDSAVEFLIAEDVSAEDTDEPITKGSGLLMSGVLQFDLSGQLKNVAAYTSSVAGSTDLSDWQPAALSSAGLPEFTYQGNPVALNFGVSSESGSATATGTAADIGLNQSSLATLTEPVVNSNAVTGFSSLAFQDSITQDGTSSTLTNYDISTTGTIYARYSNGEDVAVWQIPLAEFVSDDGLMRKGDNLFAATSAAGARTVAEPGSGNLGSVSSHYIEQSNVDMANEMVTMIITQRGFQSNSKVVTTSDEMLKTAINLKQR
ncbi:MAG: flagellar hook-basal body complex protein [Desulfovibrionaceae bacterium]|nr:flagellar hook-basal body complex protein [Desulfovibrionaceae bacterium]